MNRDDFLNLVTRFLGSPAIKYRGPHEGNSPDGFDCSGFVNFVLRQTIFPDPVPRHCNEFFDRFGMAIDPRFRKAGDLVFFSKGVYPDHMGILVSRDHFIESPGQDGQVVQIKDLRQELIVHDHTSHYEQIYGENPIGVRRIAFQNGRYRVPFLMHTS